MTNFVNRSPVPRPEAAQGLAADMGVPSFYRWLSEKYPKIVVDVVEANDGDEDHDNSKPNPNEHEFDYLYLDMNGIIHPCSHPEDKDAPPTEDDIMVEIMKYIDRLFNIVRPRKLLFMAIDGVAPRAKMNQQRSRRFRAAQEATEKAAMEAKLAAENPQLAIQKPKEKFDSNCITPGTMFMKKVSESLAYYVADRQSKDKAWANVKVILSDANVPGEGEHKIMEFIRSQRMLPGYDPNLKHCIYGLDADLIMLTLATHEAHFAILREVVFFKNGNVCHTCGQPGHMAYECKGKPAPDPNAEVKKKPYQFLYINVLREYLVKELHPANLAFDFEPERVLDDFVFLCFFVGNDFLPHLPTLEIREGAIELLMSVYNRVLPKLDGYITHNGEVNLERAEAIIREIGSLEDQILINRRQKEQQDRERRQRRKQQQNQREQGREQQRRSIESLMAPPRVSNHSVADAYRTALLTGVIPAYPDVPAPPKALTRSSTGGDDDDDEPLDEVRLGEEGWKARYYKNKFDIALEDEQGRAAHCQKMAHSYVEGLCWVLKYYYQGCCSWRWYYPYHYAPFSGDMIGIGNLKIRFEKGEPFHPFEQLMCVLPLASKQCLPEVCQKLMESPDSPLYQYYPLDFKIDMNGKRHAWQGVAVLPFIDEKVFLPAVKSVENHLSDEERQRNRWGHNVICTGGSSAFGALVRALYTDGVHGHKEIDPEQSGGLFGAVSAMHKADARFDKAYPSPLGNCPPVVPNKSVCCHYHFPEAPPGYVAPAILLPGAKPPPPVVSADEGERRRPMRPDSDAVARLLKRGMQRDAGARFHPSAGQMEGDRNRAFDDSAARFHPLPPPGAGAGGPGHKRSRSDDDFGRRGAPRTEPPPHYQQQQQHQQYAPPRGPPIAPFAFHGNAPAAAGGYAPPFVPPQHGQAPHYQGGGGGGGGYGGYQGGRGGGGGGGYGHAPQYGGHHQGGYGQPQHTPYPPPHQQQPQQPQQPYQQYPPQSDPRYRR